MYTLRLPINLPLGQTIVVSGKPIDIDGLAYSLNKKGEFYVLTIDGFLTEDLAKAYINNAWAGLMWVLLKTGISSKINLETQKIVLAENPNQAAQNLFDSFKIPNNGPIYGMISEGLPSVHLTNHRLIACSIHPSRCIISYSEKDFLEFLRIGSTFKKSEALVNDSKLRVAFELYSAFFLEISENAKFLTLIMVLETLAVPTQKREIVLNLLKKWESAVEQHLNTLDPESDDAISLKAIRQEILFRQNDSIKQQIRNLVFNTLQDNDESNAKQVAKETLKNYDLRSQLIHNGSLDTIILNNAITETKKIVEKVLRILFIQRTSN